MKNVCLLIYSLRSGGAEHVISQWSQLLEKDYNVFMTIFDDEGINYPYGGKLVNLDVPSDNRNVMTKTGIVIKRAIRLTRFVRENNIDIVISFCNECNLVNYISMHKAKKICSIRNAIDITVNPFVKYVIKSKNNTVIVQTKALYEELVRQYGEKLKNKIIVFGNPFNAKRIQSLAEDRIPKQYEDIFKHYKTIVNVASFKKPKNHPGMLRSFELLCNKYDDIYLILVGADNGQLSAIKEMLQHSKYNNRIIITGEQVNPYPYMKRATVFALPSLYEGIPNVLAEALICGTAVVAANCPTGPEELLSNSHISFSDSKEPFLEVDYGILVKQFPNEYICSYETYTEADSAFCEALIYAMEEDNNERLKNKASDGARRFNVEEYKKKLVELIDLNLSLSHDHNRCECEK